MSVIKTEARLAHAQRSCRMLRTLMPLQSWNRARAEREQEKHERDARHTLMTHVTILALI